MTDEKKKPEPKEPEPPKAPTPFELQFPGEPDPNERHD